MSKMRVLIREIMKWSKKEILNLKSMITEQDNKIRENLNETKIRFFEQIDKMDKHLVKWTKKEKKKFQITKVVS